MEPKSENNEADTIAPKEVVATEKQKSERRRGMEGNYEEEGVKGDQDGGGNEEGDDDGRLKGDNTIEPSSTTVVKQPNETQQQQQQHSLDTTQDESNHPETTSPPPSSPEEEEDNEEQEQLDEEGLRKDGYDVILCGTGLIQSILGSAFARVGKRVLHCDTNDFYGELDAVLSLSDFERLVDRFRGAEKGGVVRIEEENKTKEEGGMVGGSPGEVPSGNDDVGGDDGGDTRNYESKQSIGCSGIPLHSKGCFSSFRTHSVTTIDPNEEDVAQWSILDVGTRVVTPYGQGTVLSLPYPTTTTISSMHNSMEVRSEQDTNSLAVRLHSWTLANGASPTAYFGVPSYTNTDTTTTTTKRKDRHHKRTITTYCAHHHSVRPLSTILYKSLIRNQKRSYALDLTPGLLYANGTAVDGMVDSGVSEYCEFKSLLGLYLSSSSGGNGNGSNGSSSTTNTGNFGRAGFTNWSKKITNAGAVVVGSTGSSNRSPGTSPTQLAPTSAPPVVSSNESPPSPSSSPSSSSSTPHCVLSMVPCCKSDVFQTKLLSPVDKRRLMKFLQLASDYATATATAVDTSKKAKKKPTTDGTNHNDGDETTDRNNDASSSSSSSSTDSTTSTSATANTIDGVVQEETVSSLNERQLRQGRSLYRPQNKTVTATSDLEILQSCIQQNMGFDTYLETKHRLGERLRNIVVHAMAMGSSSSSSSSGAAAGTSWEQTYSAQDGMNDLCRHLQSLGRFGGTAFLVPLYGTGELSQAFCRSAAVHGGTYLLRRGAKQVLLEEKKKKEEGDDDDDDDYDSEKNGGCGAAKVYGIVLGANREEEEGVEQGYSRLCRVDKAIYAKNVVVSADALLVEDGTETDKSATGMMDYRIPKRGRRTLRRISILRGNPIPNNEGGGWGRRSDDVETREQRHIIVFPPGTVGNSNVVRGIVVDESVHVAPRNNCGDGCCILHLTTTIDDDDDDLNGEGDRRRIVDNSDDDGDVLERAVRTLLRSPDRSDCDDNGNSDGGGVEELYHATFSYRDHSSYAYTTAFTTPTPSGLHVCARRGLSVTIDEAFTEARSIFEAICPDHDFLRLSEVMEDIVNEATVGRTDEEDQDVMLLESAMDMIDSKLAADGEVEAIRNEPLV